MDKIKDIREEIDIIDTQIMKLLNERFDKTLEIGLLKKDAKKMILDQSRENYILDKASKFSHFPEINQIYKCIMSVSKNQQRK